MGAGFRLCKYKYNLFKWNSVIFQEWMIKYKKRGPNIKMSVQRMEKNSKKNHIYICVIKHDLLVLSSSFTSLLCQWIAVPYHYYWICVVYACGRFHWTESPLLVCFICHFWRFLCVCWHHWVCCDFLSLKHTVC